jgi:hypothetical protein
VLLVRRKNLPAARSANQRPWRVASKESS